jgi:hypothetical protein
MADEQIGGAAPFRARGQNRALNQPNMHGCAPRVSNGGVHFTTQCSEPAARLAESGARSPQAKPIPWHGSAV